MLIENLLREYRWSLAPNSKDGDRVGLRGEASGEWSFLVYKAMDLQNG